MNIETTTLKNIINNKINGILDKNLYFELEYEEENNNILNETIDIKFYKPIFHFKDNELIIKIQKINLNIFIKEKYLKQIIENIYLNKNSNIIINTIEKNTLIKGKGIIDNFYFILKFKKQNNSIIENSLDIKFYEYKIQFDNNKEPIIVFKNILLDKQKKEKYLSLILEKFNLNIEHKNDNIEILNLNCNNFSKVIYNYKTFEFIIFERNSVFKFLNVTNNTFNKFKKSNNKDDFFKKYILRNKCITISK